MKLEDYLPEEMQVSDEFRAAFDRGDYFNAAIFAIREIEKLLRTQSEAQQSEKDKLDACFKILRALLEDPPPFATHRPISRAEFDATLAVTVEIEREQRKQELSFLEQLTKDAGHSQSDEKPVKQRHSAIEQRPWSSLPVTKPKQEYSEDDWLFIYEHTFGTTKKDDSEE